jgi:invasion protein IalB
LRAFKLLFLTALLTLSMVSDATILFHVIGTQLNAYRALGGGTATLITDTGSNSDAAIITDNTSGVFSSRLIQLTHTTSFRAVQWPGGANLPANSGPISIRVRLVPRITGTPASDMTMWAAEGLGLFNTNTCLFHLDTANKLALLLKDTVKGTTFVAATSSAVISPTLTSGTPIEFAASWDGTTTAGHVLFFVNGVQLGTGQTATNAAAAWNRNAINYIMTGGSARFAIGNYDINEIEVDDTALAAYTPGAAFATDTAFDASTYTDPGIANVRSSTSYTYAGSSLTGTAAIPTASNVLLGVSTDATTGNVTLPSTSNVKTGVTFGSSLGSTGTYDGSDRWTDPGIANVRTSTAYKANSTSNNRTGTAAIPVAGDVRSGTSTDATTGTLVVPSAANVKTGVSFDTASTGTYDGSDRWTDVGIANVRSGSTYKANSTSNNRTGTAAIPTAANVRSGTATDATTGTLVVPSTANVRSGTSFDVSSTGTLIVPTAANVRSGTSVDATTGSLVVPIASNVKTGVTYDAVTVGTYTGSDRWSDPGLTNVRNGTAYKADSVTNNRTGSLLVPSALDVRDGVVFDSATSGRVVVPSAVDVRSGAAFDVDQLGTLAVPNDSDVRLGVAVDAGVGTCAVPSPDDVRLGIDVDDDTGNLRVPFTSQVADGVVFDSNDSSTGTLLSITNLIRGVTLRGSNHYGVLKKAN